MTMDQVSTRASQTSFSLLILTVLERGHTLPCCSPMICLMFWISALPVIWAMLASRTFSSLPLHPKAP